MTSTYLQVLMDDMSPAAGDPSDDALLLRYATSGEQPAIAAFVQRHAALAWRIAARALGHASDADDVVQSAFLQVLRHAPSYRPRGDARGWLATIVLNEARQLLRRRARQRRHESVPQPLPAVPPDPELLEQLRLALNQLPDRFRVPLELHLVEGLAHAEIARVLGIAEGTARSRTSRAISRLRGLLGRDAVLAVALLPRWQTLLAAPPPGMAEHLVQVLAQSRPAGTWWIPRMLLAGGSVALLLLAAAWLLAHHHHASQGSASWSAAAEVVVDPPVRLPPADPFAAAIEVRLWHDDLPGSLLRIARALPSTSPVGFAAGPDLQVENGLVSLPWEGVTYQQQQRQQQQQQEVPARPVGAALDALAQQLGLRWRRVGAVAALSKPAQAGTLAAALPLLQASETLALSGLPGVEGLIDDLDALPVLLRLAFRNPAPSTQALRVIFGGMEISDPASCGGEEAALRMVSTFSALVEDRELEGMARRVVALRGSHLETLLAIDLVGAAHDQLARADLLELLGQPQTSDHAAAALVGMAKPVDAVRIAEVLTSLVREHERSRQEVNHFGMLHWEAGAVPVVSPESESLPGPGLYRCVDMLGTLGGSRSQALLVDLARRTTVYTGLRVEALRALASLPQGLDELPAFAQDANADVAAAGLQLLAHHAASWQAYLAQHPPSDLAAAKELAAAAEPEVDVARLLRLAALRPPGKPWQVKDVLATAMVVGLARRRGGGEDLVFALADPLPEVRRLAMRSLCELRIPSGVAAIIALADHGDEDARQALTRCQDPDAEASVIRELSQPGAEVASSLNLLRGWVPHGPDAISGLLAISQDHPDPRVRLAALNALHGPDPRLAAARLAMAVRDPDPQNRGAFILELVMRSSEPKAHDALLAAFDDPDRYVRACAVFATGMTGQPWSRARLLSTLQTDSDDQVRAYAGAVLHATDDETVTTALITALSHDPSARVRRAVAARLAQDCLGLERVPAHSGELAGRLRAALTMAATSDADSSVRATVERSLQHERDEWLRPPTWRHGGTGDLGGPGGAG